MTGVRRAAGQPGKDGTVMETVTSTVLKCPECDGKTQVEMPEDRCMIFFECPHCGAALRPEEGDCCVFCSYAAHPCPPMQGNAIQVKDNVN